MPEYSRMGRSIKPPSKAQKSDGRFGTKTSDKSRPKRSNRSTNINPPVKMTTYTRPPQRWPASLPYLSAVHLDNSLTPEQRELYHPINVGEPDAVLVSSQCTFSPISNPAVVIEPIKTPSHPAYPQSGLFAARQLHPGTHILDYTGLLHSCPLPSCSTSDYDLAFLDRDASLAIDGARMGNEARFINDYHGIRPDGPNAVFEEYFVKVKGVKGKEVWEARMGVWVNPACPGIAKGEEICLSYGKGYWRARSIGVLEQQNTSIDMPTTMPEEDLTQKLGLDRSQSPGRVKGT